MVNTDSELSKSEALEAGINDIPIINNIGAMIPPEITDPANQGISCEDILILFCEFFEKNFFNKIIKDNPKPDPI